jgi:hypothetical protein
MLESRKMKPSNGASERILKTFVLVSVFCWIAPPKTMLGRVHHGKAKSVLRWL